MIAFIKGKIAEIEEDKIILESQSMGYEIYMAFTEEEQRLRTGDEIKVNTYLHVREDAMQLYGFLKKDSLEIFKLLLGVNGIGPKAALGILSALSADALRFAVLSDDVKAIVKAPGIGKKTAQKLILELKDKFSLEDAFERKLENVQEDGGIPVQSDAKKEAVQALTALGYSNTDALRAVSKVEDSQDMDVETLLKAALKKM